MLDPQQAFTIDEFPYVRLYPDSTDKARFYAVPQSPRVAIDEQGTPLVSLLLYGRKQGAQVQPLGGQFILTTTLALTQEERTGLLAALAQRLAQDPSSGDPADGTAGEGGQHSARMQGPRSMGGTGHKPSPSQPPLQPDLLAPDWLSGEVQVVLADQLSLSGTPSLSGANECTLSLNLNAENTSSLLQAWNNGLPDAWITYRVQLSALKRAQTSGGLSSTGSSEQPGHSQSASQSFTFDVSRAEVYAYPLVIQGPLTLTETTRSSHLQLVTL